MTTEGTTSTDVVFSACTYGFASLVDESMIPQTYTGKCLQLQDADNDGLFDRYLEARTHKQVDTRPNPCCGAAYDECAFDKENDIDGDKICAGDAPSYTSGTPSSMRTNQRSGLDIVDKCPTDQDNDADQDGICDDDESNEKSVGNGLIQTWDFTSMGTQGWSGDVDQIKFIDTAGSASEIEWNGKQTCPDCVARFKKGEGSITSSTFRIEHKTIEFTIGQGTSQQSIELFVKINREFTSVRSTTAEYKAVPEGTFNVVWNIAEYLDSVAYIKVTNNEKKETFIFDNFKFYDGASGCLSECMKIVADQGQLFFEEDAVPYVSAKKMHDYDVYCRKDTEGVEGGSKIIATDAKRLSFIPTQDDELAMDYLPRCLRVAVKGAREYHISIDEDGARKFVYEAGAGTPTQYCVYNTMKPWCADYYAPLNAYKKKLQKDICDVTVRETGCRELCYSTHCDGHPKCGGTKAFDDCAKCCDNDYNSPSKCFRRRRLVSESLEQSKTAHDCAKECILFNLESGEVNHDDARCKGFNVKDGECKLATRCHVKPSASDAKPAYYYKIPGVDMYEGADLPKTEFGTNNNGLARRRTKRFRKKN